MKKLSELSLLQREALFTILRTNILEYSQAKSLKLIESTNSKIRKRR